MDRGRSVVSSADFAKLSPEAKVKTNYARVWNEKNEQLFAARGGTYRLDGDKLHHTVTMSLYTSIIGVDRVLKIVRLDKRPNPGVCPRLAGVTGEEQHRSGHGGAAGPNPYEAPGCQGTKIS